MRKSTKASLIHQEPSLKEVLADELIGAATIDSLSVLTFSINRVAEGVGGQDAPKYKTIVCRLALTETALRQLSDAIPRLNAAVRHSADKPTSGQQPN